MIHTHQVKSSKRLFCKSWLQTFIWLKYDEAEGYMYCKHCQEIQKKNSYTSRCKNFRLSDIQKHGKCHDHSAAAEAYLMKTSGATITAAFSRMTSINEEAVMAAMRNIYWLAKEDIASLKYNIESFVINTDNFFYCQ